MVIEAADPLAERKLVDQSFHCFERRDRAGVFADQFGFGPGERFGECVPFIGSEPSLGDDRWGGGGESTVITGGAGGSRAVTDSFRRRSVRQRAMPPRIRPPFRQLLP